MAYTDVADLRGALAPGGAPNPATAASLTDVELADAIAEAQQEVDGRLAARYAVPFPDGAVPPLVAQITRDLAAFKATLVHRKGDPLDAESPARLRHDHAQALLSRLAAGQLELPGVDVAVGALREAAVVNPYEGTLFGLGDFGLGVR